MSLHDEPLIVLDGACGTTLQTMNIPPNVWDTFAGCNEYLNLSAPEYIIDFHKQFLEAGAMAVETNTFGATSIVLSEYGLEDRVEEINIAAVENAREAIRQFGSDKKRYIIGSVGPTTKLPALGHISPDDFTTSLAQQLDTLINCNVDGILIETCQDILQVKLSLVTCFELLEKRGADIPVLCSVTFEKLGTMLVGTDIGAVCATISPFPVFSLGLNCATGPTDMVNHIHYLKKHWDRRISCYPNQGMPELINGETVYSMSPEEYARHMVKFITEDGVSIVGGCCGTSPTHIKELTSHLENIVPKRVFA